jgi:membrane-associated phospholipid phosphatase
MNKFRTLVKNLNGTDFIVVSFSLFLILLNIIFHGLLEYWWELVLYNIGLIIVVFVIAYYDTNRDSSFWRQLHFWYLVPLIFLMFKEMYLLVYPIRQVDYDQVLIQIDRWIFGFDPTVELYKIASPLLTEILQIVYGTFFFLPVILGLELILNNRNEELKYETFIIVYGFFLSYIGYLLVPAIGPRFTLHEFSNINTELPGLFLTNFLREVVNAGESIPAGLPNPATVVQRDVFPSGHTQMTLLVMYLSVKFKVKMRYFFLVVGSLLIFSTVYLRYHYVIDLIGGVVFMLLTLWSGYYLYNWWMKKTGANRFEFNKS